MNHLFALGKFLRRSCHYMVRPPPPPLARILIREIHPPPPERNGLGTPLDKIYDF